MGNKKNKITTASSPAKTESGAIRQRQQEDYEQVDNNVKSPNNNNNNNTNNGNNVNLLLMNLNSNPEQIYRETIGKILQSTLPPVKKNNKSGKDQQKQQQQPPSSFLSQEKASFFADDQQSATMLVRFPDKHSAKKFAQKINHSNLFGSFTSTKNETGSGDSNNGNTHNSSNNALVVPTVLLKPKYDPCALKITELLAGGGVGGNNRNQQQPVFTLFQLQQYLSSNPGFLSVSRVATTTTENNKKGSSTGASDNNNRCFIATYADDGAALQAKALMSGRAFHGIHLLFEKIDEESQQFIPLL